MNETSIRSDRDGGGRALLIAASLIIVIAGVKAAKTLILPFLLAMFLAMVTLPLLTLTAGTDSRSFAKKNQDIC